MKKRFILILILILCFVASCTTPDKITYPDRGMYELQGQVKDVKVTTTSNGTAEHVYYLRFNKKGMCTRHKTDNLWPFGTTVNNVERDHNNRIKIYTTTGAKDNEPKVEIRYVYDTDGKVTAINYMWYGKDIATESYEYGNDGILKKIERRAYDFNYPTTETLLFRNSKFDDKNNWIEREGLKINEKKENGRSEIISESLFTEKRVISYY